jgi:FkbM family methyltransferase
MTTSTSTTKSGSWLHFSLRLALIPVVLVAALVTASLVSPVSTSRGLIRGGDILYAYWPVRAAYTPIRLINLLYWAGVLHPVQREIRPGAVFELDARDMVAREILGWDVWEKPNTELILGSLRKGSVMFDVGAHIGYYSVLGSQVVGPGGRIVSVEPNPQTLPRLRKNLELSHASNVTVEDVACTDKETTLTFYQAGIRNTGASSISESNARNADHGEMVRSVTVRGRTLDSIVQELGLQRVDFVKIDVEGAEVQVLRGMKNTLAKYQPHMLIEMKPAQLASMGTSIGELRSVLRDSGYVPGRMPTDDDGEWVPADGR